MPQRLRRFAPAELDSDQRAIYDEFAPGGSRQNLARRLPLMDESGHLLGPPSIWLLSPPIGSALQQMGLAIRERLHLTPRVQEIAILVVAQRRQSPFERYAHEQAARSAGLTDDQIAALSAGSGVSFDDAAEQSSFESTQAILDRGALTDAEYTRAADALGEAGLFELSALIGWYQLIAVQLAVFEVLPPS